MSDKNRAILAELKAKSLEDVEFRKKLIDNPKGVLKDAGVDIPEGGEIKFVENTANVNYIVLPYAPKSGKLSDDDLEAVAGGGSAVGYQDVAVATTAVEAAEVETTVFIVAEAVLFAT